MEDLSLSTSEALRVQGREGFLVGTPWEETWVLEPAPWEWRGNLLGEVSPLPLSPGSIFTDKILLSLCLFSSLNAD